MKRLVTAVICGIALTACGGLRGGAADPDGALSAAADAMRHLQTATFDVSGNLSAQLPPPMRAALFAGTPSADSLAAKFPYTYFQVHGGGAFAAPDRLELSTQLQAAGGLAFGIREVIAGGHLRSTRLSPSDVATSDPNLVAPQLGQLVVTMVPQLLTSASVVQRLGTGKFDGMPVDGFVIKPKLSTLLDEIGSDRTLMTGDTATVIRNALQHSNLFFEVWVTRSDHLVRRIVSEGTFSVSAAQLLAGSTVPAARLSGVSVPIGERITIDLNGFNQPVAVD